MARFLYTYNIGPDLLGSTTILVKTCNFATLVSGAKNKLKPGLSRAETLRDEFKVTAL